MYSGAYIDLLAFIFNNIKERSGYLVGHRLNIQKYISPVVCCINIRSVTYNSSIKHISCMKVSFWVSSRRARVGAASEASVQKLTFIQTVKVIIMFNRQTSGYSMFALS